MKTTKDYFWLDGYWLPTIEAAIAKAKLITANYTKTPDALTIYFTHTGEPADLTAYAVKGDDAWTFATTGYAVAA